MIVRIAVSLIVVTASLSSHAADWPEFRGPAGNGIVAGVALPTEWSPQHNVMWRTEVPGQGWSSPIAVGDSLFLTAAVPQPSDGDSPDYDLTLFTIDAQTGQVTQQTKLFRQKADAPEIHSKNSHASPTPIFDGSHLYLHFGHLGTACTTLTGEVVWKNDTLGYEPVHGNGGSPAVVDDLLIFSRDGAKISEITALDKSTGRAAWQLERNVQQPRPFSFCSPLAAHLGGRQQLILPGSNVVQSVDPSSGKELWRVTYDGYSVIPRPIVEAGLVFVCTGFDRPSLLAIDPTGTGDVTDTHVKWEAKSNIPKTPSLIGFAGKIAMVSDRGIASCLEAQSGKPLWKERVGGNFSASPLLSGKHLYLMSEEGVCTILDIANDPTKVAVNSLDERSLASPSVIENDLLIRTDKALYRIAD